MSLPKPSSSSVLDDSCSVIHDNTLYSYSPEGFVSLRLEEGEEWKELDGGESVTGAACVGSDAAFYVVGGSGGSTEYLGLQKYDYGSGEWSAITPPGGNQILKNRQWHGATYIAANDKIFVYAGTVTGAQGRSEETFTVAASEPYTIDGFNSAGAPTGVDPILLPWEGSDAVMLGGDPGNTQVWLFNADAGWRNFGATLAGPVLSDPATQQATLVNGDDGSKNLLVFDMAASPNSVSRVVLRDGNGQPVMNSAPVEKRQLTQDDWPSYNDTLAPSSTRTNFALAQGDDGTVVLSGGNDQEPLSIFDTKENSWVDPEDILLDQTQTTTSSSSATSSTATSTSASASTSATTSASTSSFTSSSTTISSSATSEATPTSTESVAPFSSDGDKSDGDDGLSSMAILGITLGTIFGFILILAAILFWIRRRKKRQYHSEAAKPRGTPSDEKDPSAFASIVNKPPPSPGNFRGHRPQASAESFSSMAILMGRMGQQKSGGVRKGSVDTVGSAPESFHKQFKSTISKPVPQAQRQPEFAGQDEKGVAFDPSVVSPVPRPRNTNNNAEPDDPTRRSSGWNKYWSGGSALQILGFGGNKRNTMASDRSSRYSQGTEVMQQNPRVTQDSATVPPLNFEGRAQVNSVNSGSPVVSSGYPQDGSLKEGMAGKIERPTSRVSSSGYSSGIPESVNEMWDPTSGDKPWGSERAPSSAYASSAFQYGTPLAPSNAGARAPPAGSGVSTQPQLSMASKSSDMSWLNLGDQKQNESRF